MSKTIEEIKNEYAKEKAHINWSDLIGYTTANSLTKVSTAVAIDNKLTEVAERYAQSQTQELTTWKESASKVFKNLDLQTLGKILGIGLGEDVSTNVLPKVKELIEQNRELVEMLQLLLQSLDYDALGVMSGLIIEDLKELLTKYKKP